MGMGREDLMGDDESSLDSMELWRRAIAESGVLLGTLAELRADRHSLLARLGGALSSREEELPALLLLGCLENDYTIELVGPVVQTCLSHRYALIARQLLGRLPFDDAVRFVPPAVWQQLDATPDDDAYRRCAELLQHLGLGDALGDLCERAQLSGDPNVREVGEDFSGNRFV